MEQKKTERKKLELLAPGGSMESLKAAVNAGADAIYMGGRRFSARAYAQNADGEELLAAMDYCHIHGRKLYLTVNTLLKEREMGELYDYLLPLYQRGVDGVLVQDLGVFQFIRRNFPGLPLHASTQMTVMGVQGARLLEKMGAVRVVPARELSLEEIREITEGTGLEVECFVHGALCYCYSGQCLMSSLIGGRSGNRGRCAQPCRLPYSLYEDGKKISREGKYLLSLKDICTLEMLPDLAEAGVCSFKIEGRMKRPEYAAGVTRIYRRYLDRYLEQGRKNYRVEGADVGELADLYSRGGFSKGYYQMYSGRSMMAMERPNHRGTTAAEVLSAKKGQLRLRALEDLEPGDVLEPESRAGGPGEDRGLTLKEPVRKGREFFAARIPGWEREKLLVRVRSKRLLEELQEQYGKKEIQEKIKGNFILQREKAAILTVSCFLEGRESSCQVEGAPPAPALRQPLDKDTVFRCLTQTGGTPFVFEKLDVTMEEGLFCPVQELKELRRRALEGLRRRILEGYERSAALPVEEKTGGESAQGACQESAAGTRQRNSLEPSGEAGQGSAQGKPLLTAYVETMDQLCAIAGEPGISRIYADCCMFLPVPEGKVQETEDGREAFLETARLLRQKGKQCFLALPQVWRSGVKRQVETVFDRETLGAADGILLRCGDQLELLERYAGKKEMIADAGIYTYNREARQFLRSIGIAADTLPLECSRAELWERGCRDSECIVYGRLPLMVTANCLAKNTDGCRHSPRLLWLEDRKRARFPVKTVCSICTNVVYNSVPLDLISCAEEILALQPISCRLMFTTEDGEQARRIAAAARRSFLEGVREKEAIPGTTRGHFKRGVE